MPQGVGDQADKCRDKDQIGADTIHIPIRSFRCNGVNSRVWP
jgi:hypothetical protein